SADGGGAGALSELLILDRMMYRTKTEGQLDVVPAPWECFELIGGSGMGGIIALMLGRLHMSAKDVISAYATLRPQSKRASTEEFRASKFEDALKKIFKDEKMEDVSSDGCKTFVCAMNERNMNAGIPHLFRAYHTLHEPASNCMIWEAARATSAMPGIFKPMEIGHEGMKQRYVDGCLGNNNPTVLVLEEAQRIYPSAPIVLICSIGSGHPETIHISKSRHLDTITKVVKNIATDCEKTHEDITRRFQGIPNTYFRLNVQQGMQALEPKHWNKLSEVSAHTEGYLRMEDIQNKLTKAVKVILSTQVHHCLDPRILVSASSAYLRVCPASSFRFTGCQDILRKMTEYFNTAIGWRHVFLLYGLGGAGKSQIAFKFVEMSAVPQPR
ncbi:FabD lysophospholipase-like protein, partial [Mycena epipterygia]